MDYGPRVAKSQPRLKQFSTQHSLSIKPHSWMEGEMRPWWKKMAREEGAPMGAHAPQ